MGMDRSWLTRRIRRFDDEFVRGLRIVESRHSTKCFSTPRNEGGRGAEGRCLICPALPAGTTFFPTLSRIQWAYGFDAIEPVRCRAFDEAAGGGGAIRRDQLQTAVQPMDWRQ